MKKPDRQPRKITRQYLENAALYYLQRFSTSAENLKNVLRRKIEKSCAFHKTPPEEFYAAVDDMIARYTSAGLLNDPLFACAKTATLRRQGQSRRAIEAKLRQKGLAKEDIQTALSDVDKSDSAELDAAIVFARRKKLGQGRRELQKELAAMGRAGFSYEISIKALGRAYPED